MVFFQNIGLIAAYLKSFWKILLTGL